MRMSSVICGCSTFSRGHRGRANRLRSETAVGESGTPAEGAAGNDRARFLRSRQHAVRALADTETVDSGITWRSEYDDRAQVAQPSGRADPHGFRWIRADPHLHSSRPST